MYVLATEVARPDATNQQPFAHPGECDETSDGWSCDGPCPGEWLGVVKVQQGGETLAEAIYDSPWGIGITVTLDGPAVLSVEDLEGAEVAIAIPDVVRPVPVIDEITPDAITWHSDPSAASAVVAVGSGFGGPRCHVIGDADVTAIPSTSATTAVVTAFAPPAVVDTAFGEAEVWVGATATRAP